MLGFTQKGGSVLVPNQGWFLFGGFGNNLLTMQKLSTLRGNWTAGPNLYQNVLDYFMCGVQVSLFLHYNVT
jgi:hypothetical protein